MEPIFDGTIQLLGKALEGSKARHKMISSNIANVDTPGYKALDINFQKQLRNAYEKTGKIDHNQIQQINWTKFELTSGQDTEQRIDKNTVDLGQHLVELNKNSLLYNSFIRALSAKVKILQTAVSEQV